MDNGGVIGKGNGLPWVCKPDMDRLKELVKGKPIIIGGRTYDNLPENSFIRKESDVIVYRRTTPHEAIMKAFSSKNTHYLLGGEWMYNYFLTYISKWHLSIIDHRYEGDKFLNISLLLNNHRVFDLVGFKTFDDDHKGVSFYEVTPKKPKRRKK
jgi:dihydrofolate reductase